MLYLFCDLETYSEVPLKNGTHAYAEKVEVLLFAYALENEPTQVWDRTETLEMPEKLTKALKDSNITTVWHNGAMFDRHMLRHNLGIDIPITRIHDTMVQALTHSLPGGLDKLCEIFKLPADKAKDKSGREFINLFCKPRPKNMKVRRATRHTHPEEWERFKNYARLDIESMRILMKKMPTWNYAGSERELWHLDQKINDRGVCVDVELAQAAITAIDEAQKNLSLRTHNITGGDVGAASQRDAMLAHILKEYGVDLPDMQSSTLERRVDDPNLPFALRELLAIRLQTSTTSTAKYKALVNAVSSDGQLRGTLQFCGASRTGRWSGRTFQPQNLPSRNLLPQKEIEEGIAALKLGAVDLVSEDVMHLTSSAIRGCITAPPLMKLVVSDLSNIEGRNQAWLAGEEWKLQAFRDFDTILGTDDKGDPIRKGHDLYKLAYAKSFGIDPKEVTKDQRQVGKVQELALGYAGGVGAFVAFALNMNINLDDMAKAAWDNIPPYIKEQATDLWKWAQLKERTFGLAEQTYIVCDSFKRMWREAHPNIEGLWGELDENIRKAINNPGLNLPCRKVIIRRDNAWLRIVLPSGRSLCYPSPQIEKGRITYMGINQYSRKWDRLQTYGGKLFENICQAVARDVMAANMPKIEQVGYEIVLSVHDELITQTPDNKLFNTEELSELLSANPGWALDMPLAAGGFESYRYRKD